jgi:two-component system sensor histidine kinase YesM
MKKNCFQPWRFILGRFYRINLKKKITVIISFTVIVILLFCFIVFSIASYINNKQSTEEYLRNSVYQKKEKLDIYLYNLDHSAYTIMFSNWVQQLMVYKRTATYAEFQSYLRNASHFLSSFASISNDISYVLMSGDTMVWSNNTLHYDTNYRIETQPWFDQLLRDKKYIEYGKSELFAGRGGLWSMTIYYTVTSYYNFSLLGFLAVNVTADKLNFLFNDTPGEFVTIGAAETGILVSTLPSGLAEPPGSSWFSYAETFMDGLWTIRVFRPAILNPFSSLGSYNFFFLLLIPIIGIFVLINVWFSRYLSVPIVMCKNSMREIHRGNFGVTIDNRYHDEIGELIDGFNDMSGALVTLTRQNAEIDKMRRDAEITILQQKMNPHFLYNTLEIINALILDGQNAQAVRVCEMLGRIYQYNLMNRKWVTLREECDYVKRYLLILLSKMDKLSVVWESDEAALETDILRLVLQPLVENAVLHGLRPKPSDCCLTIRIHGAERTEITIMDNGLGMAPEILEEIARILEQVRKKIPPEGSHIGIYNVYQRLYLEYGEALEFSIESRLGYGTRVFLSLPRFRPQARLYSEKV